MTDRTNARAQRSAVAPAAAGLAGVALVAVGVVGSALLLPQAVPASLAAPAGERTVAVTTETYDGARTVAATPQMAEPEVVRITDTGRVTRSDCQVGSRIASGTSPLTVDDRPAVALATSVPLWRDLDVGASGADVQALQAELTRLGHTVPQKGTYDARTRAAVQSVFRAAGVARPSGSLPVASVLWLPEPEIVVASCAVRTGATLDAEGEVATVAGGLVSLRLTDAPDEGWVVRYQDVTAPVEPGGLVTDAALRAAVEAGPTLATALADGGSGNLELEVVLATPQDVVVVPPAAIVATGGSTGCVVGDGTPRAVRIVSSALGRALVAFDDGPAPSRVDARPDDSVSCP
ncbi:peptidoglycan-binding domain-containing protein [Cellulomonas hominis]